MRILTLLLLAASPAWGMDMTFQPAGDGTVAFVMQGPIVEGDARKLRGVLRRRPADERISKIVLNSPGGSVAEAKDMARIILLASAPVLVPRHGVCASACFLLFAAGRHKEAEPGAMVGVHSASVGRGSETIDTLGITTLMAREAAGYGVPAAITGRMVTTQPGQMAWLSRDELVLMGARIMDGADAVPPGQRGGAGSDWSRGFVAGQALAVGGACAAPAGVDEREWLAGCESGHLSGGGKVAPVRSAGTGSDWSRGFDYGKREGAAADCDHVDRETTVPADFSLGCRSGRGVGR